MCIKRIISTCLIALCFATPIAQAEVYELRTYKTPAGRLDDLLDLFEDHLLAHIEKFGIRHVAYWVPTDEEDENTLIYMVAHESREAAVASWQAFHDDPATQPIFDEAYRNGRIIIDVTKVFMNTTEWSPEI